MAIRYNLFAFRDTVESVKGRDCILELSIQSDNSMQKQASMRDEMLQSEQAMPFSVKKAEPASRAGRRFA